MTKYFAFISYKRGGLDEQVANWIHSKLEKYPYPVDMELEAKEKMVENSIGQLQVLLTNPFEK